MNGLTLRADYGPYIVTAISPTQHFYTDAGLSSAVTLPATITSTTTWYCAPAYSAAYTFTCKQLDGTDISPGVSQWVGTTADSTLNPRPSLGQIANDFAALRDAAFMPSGAIAETLPRPWGSVSNGTVLSSGRLSLAGIALPAGSTITTITVLSATTALSAGTNQWFALYDSSFALLRQTADDTSTAWSANSLKTLTLTTPYTTTYSGLYYVGINVTASTVPTLASHSGSAAINARLPYINAVADTGLTDTAPATATVTAGAGYMPYAYVS